MAGETLKPETAELFRSYRESHRHIFLEQLCGFIDGAGCARDELDAIYHACVARAKERRAPKGGKRGKPRGRKRMADKPPDAPAVSDLACWIEGGPYELYERDWAQHWYFRTLCVSLGDYPVSRPLFLEQIVLFAQGANHPELVAIRGAVKKRRKTVKRPSRGRPDWGDNEQLMSRARQVTWMRLIEQRSDEEIADSLGIPTVETVRNPRGWTEIQGNRESIKRQLRRLEDYLAAAIWNAIPPNHVRHSTVGWEIAPGALDNKLLQIHIEFRTDLPFRTHPGQCKRIVLELWPRGSAADWRIFERGFTYREKKQRS